MSNRTHLKRAGRAGAALAAGVACLALPAAAQAATVDLATAGPFVALGGQTVTNTGPSVLNGDLGVAPGTSLVGFGSPAVVNGATHANDAVANQAQDDLTAAYLVAEAEPVPPGNDLTGTNLGNRTLFAGAYGYSSSAQLTDTLTLDAQGDPDAQFVFEIGSTLTTASASRVELINGASPCNVYWQIGSSATIGSTTAFQGNVMALTDISLNDGASVIGRVLARNGEVTMINNVLDASGCQAASTSPTTPGTTPPGTTPGTPASPGSAPPSNPAMPTRRPARRGTAVILRGPRGACTDGFRAAVRGKRIERVVFRLDGRRIASAVRPPFRVFVRAAPGRHVVTARVTFTDATRAKSMSLRYRACAAKVLRPRRGPSQFTG